MIEIDLDGLAEHCRDLIWNELKTELSLVTCQQGCPEQLATPADLAGASPAVLLDPPRLVGGKPGDSGMPCLEATVTIGITFIRPIAADEEHPRTTVQKLQKIAALFTEPDFRLSGWDGGDGLDVDEVFPAEISHEHDLSYEDSAARLTLGTITLQARIIAYDPAG